MKMKKLAALVLAGALLITSATGCGSGGGTGSQAAASTAGGSSAPAAKVKLTALFVNTL